MREEITKSSKLQRTVIPIHFKQHIAKFYGLRCQTEQMRVKENASILFKNI
jgi:hypothetical protein